MAFSRTQLAAYVKAKAPTYGLDPAAVLAVASQEGAGGGIGDYGTSFGPWQLHQGGAYPSSAPQTPAAAQAWAWSPTGIDYALSRMASVATGLRGNEAVQAIVTRFERPQNPAKEVAGAEAALGTAGQYSGPVSITAQPAGGHATGGGGGRGFWGSIEHAAGDVVGGVEGAGGSLIKGAEDLINGPVDFFKAMVWLVNPLTWLRGVEGLFGFVLMLGGVAIMLGADRALKNVPGPTGAAAALAAEA